ncbi:VOC family protein [Amycolatopsis sp. H20-H5]|uniref:VOC family protein n=1 Tax=Amycolatopsis sp. H20-H5 TaxID=3046309 RepID=UPI002DB75686|nr:VOC family protein [Amycolatopsis sp. H20-H5]MEC3973762.1 VOC family protein [Amycolatopsis sp. H20-H5]
MTSVVQNINFDCANAYDLALFWSGVTGKPVHPDDGPGDPEVIVEMANGVTLFFGEVPEPKTVKNRVHVCLTPDIPREAEVERLLALGAAMLHDLRNPDGTGWAVLGDPEGNEFCVLRSAAERALTS